MQTELFSIIFTQVPKSSIWSIDYYTHFSILLSRPPQYNRIDTIIILRSMVMNSSNFSPNILESWASEILWFHISHIHISPNWQQCKLKYSFEMSTRTHTHILNVSSIFNKEKPTTFSNPTSITSNSNDTHSMTHSNLFHFSFDS